MNCAQARRELQGRIDGELGGQALADLDRHLDRCASCRAALDGLESALASLRDGCLLRAPASFEASVLDRLRAERPPSRRFLPLHAAAVALAALGGTWLALPRPRTLAFPVSVLDPAPRSSVVERPEPPVPVLDSPPPPIVVEAPAPGDPLLGAPPPEREEVRPAPRVDWEVAGREGIRLVAAAAELLTSLARNAPAPEPDPPAPPPPAAPPDPAPAVPAEAPPPVRPPESATRAPARAPQEGRAVLLRQGNETVLFSSGPPEREIPALLSLLRDQGGEGADLALARLALLARNLASHGIPSRDPSPEAPSILDRFDSILAPSVRDDARARAVEKWERWWGANRAAIRRASRADLASLDP